MAARRTGPARIRAAVLLAALGAAAQVTACQGLLGIDGDRPLAGAGPDGSLTADGGVAPLDATSGADHVSVGANDSGSTDDSALASNPDAALATTAEIANGRADEAVEAMLLNFWDPAAEGLYATSLQGSTSLADLATFTQAWEAVIDATERYGQRASAASTTARFFGTVETLYNSQVALDSTTNSSLPFDQELYLILAMIRAYDVTGQSAYLLAARNLFTDVQNNAWDTTCCTIGPKIPFGGVWKDRAHSEKSTGANAAAAIAAARLAVRTSGSAADSYFSFATRVYDYWSQYMVAPTGQVYDSVSATASADASASGVDTTTAFTYDQGLMIGAAVEVGKAMEGVEDASTTTLTLANLMASYLLQNEVAPVSVPVTSGTSTGPILSDGDETTCTGECPLYKGFAARYLAELYAADPSHPEYATVLERSASAAYAFARDPAAPHLYDTDWGTPFSTAGAAAVLGATSSAAAVLSAAASISGPPTAPANPTSYQATEGVLAQVGLATTFGGYTGWGYVNSPGSTAEEGVTFPVTVPKTDLYALSFFYRFETTNTATRDVSINGAAAVSTMFGPITQPNWSGPPLVIVSALNANAINPVSVLFDLDDGSNGLIDLDELQWTENVMSQPVATDWDNSFPAGTTLDIAAASSPPNATTWTGTVTISSTDGEWIKVYPQMSPFKVSFDANQSYVAAVTLTGSNSTPYYLDFYNGVTDISSTQVYLTSTPQTLQTPPFTVGAGAQTEFQLRIPDNGGAPVDVDVTMSGLGIYLVPSPSP